MKLRIRGNSIRVRAMRSEQPINGAETLQKDFACLTPFVGEDEADLFPNPAQPTS